MGLRLFFNLRWKKTKTPYQDNVKIIKSKIKSAYIKYFFLFTSSAISVLFDICCCFVKLLKIEYILLHYLITSNCL